MSLNHNDLVFTLYNLESPKITTDDVLLKPSIGKLASRSDANTKSSFVFGSPMDVVTGLDLSKAMLDLNQCPVFCRFLDEEKKLYALSNFSFYDNFWFSVGSSIEDYEFLIKNLPKNAALSIAVDVAHGATSQLEEVYKNYSRAPWCKRLMSGTVATVEGAKHVVDAGCTHVRVGIGPGSACSTRIVTGVGYPNLSAVYEIYRYFSDLPDDNYRPFIIADGGIRNSSDVIKYLAAGANGVMLGSMLSSLKESEGWIHPKKTFFSSKESLKPYKYYRGQASASFQLDRRGRINSVPEGVQSPNKIYQTISFATFQDNLEKAISSSLSYLGLTSISQLNPTNVSFIRITPSGLNESRPHILFS